MTEDRNAVLSVKPLGIPWETQDPFLFCVYHAEITSLEMRILVLASARHGAWS